VRRPVAFQHRGQLSGFPHPESGAGHSLPVYNTPSLICFDTWFLVQQSFPCYKTHTHTHIGLQYGRPGVLQHIYPKPLLLLPRHSHPGASDPHPSPGSGSVNRLHVLSCPRSCCGSYGHHRPHHPGCSRFSGLPATFHARFVPHLGLGAGDGREAKKGSRSNRRRCFSFTKLYICNQKIIN